MRLRFLGTGTSFGVPQIGCACAVCQSSDPRDKRTRVGALVETDAGERLLIDTPPELRLQLVAAGATAVDAVLYTHEHADHIHGIDDLRAFTMRRDVPLPLYGEASTLDVLRVRFPYIVDRDVAHMPGTTRPEGQLVPIAAGVPFTVGATTIVPVRIPHGRTPVLGFRIANLGYITDAKTVPEEAIAAMAGVRVLVLNALWRRPHATHLSIDEAVAVAQRIGAAQTFLIHLTHDHAHAELAAALPPGISPAFDGLMVTLDPEGNVRTEPGITP